MSVTSPAPGSVLYVGDTLTIGWASSGGDPEHLFAGGVILEFSLNHGRSWICITCTTGSVMPDDTLWGNFRWVIPPEVCNLNFDQLAGGSAPCKMKSTMNDSVLIRITEYFDAASYVMSEFFSIKPVTAKVPVLAPARSHRKPPAALRPFRILTPTRGIGITVSTRPFVWGPAGRRLPVKQ